MKNLNERVVEVSRYLQVLTGPEFFTEVQDAVEKKDRRSLAEVCRKAKIPAIYVSVIVSVLLAVSPLQKWPPSW